jgi:hypothetical protein
MKLIHNENAPLLHLSYVSLTSASGLAETLPGAGMKLSLIKGMLGGGRSRCAPLGKRVAWRCLLRGEGNAAVAAFGSDRHG